MSPYGITRPQWVNIIDYFTLYLYGFFEVSIAFFRITFRKSGTILHLPLDKMAAISQTILFCILIDIPLKFVPKGPIDNNSALA